MAGRSGTARKRLLVLGAGPAQLGLLQTARELGDLELVVADRDAEAIGFAYADERAVVSTEDEQDVERLARVRAVAGIVSPGADWPVGVAARIAERMGLPHPIDAATAALATVKTRQRERFAAAGVPHARALDPAGDITFPCVVKSPDRQGQRGLTLVHDRQALARAVAFAASESRGGGVLVEELVDGPEVTVNAFVSDGVFHALTVTDRVTADPPAFGVALAHVWPSAAAGDGVDVVAVAEQAAAALGIRNGPVYVQLRIGPDGPRVMEVAARLGGGHDAELVEAVTGVNLNELVIRGALGNSAVRGFAGESLPGISPGRRLGETPGGDARGRFPGETPAGDSPGRFPGETSAGDSRGRFPCGGCILFLVPPAGVLRGVTGAAAAEAVEGVRWLRLYRKPGWRFGPLLRGADRAGAVLAVGPDRDTALARARRAAEAVRFEVDADAP